jgi:hypothetical protein
MGTYLLDGSLHTLMLTEEYSCLSIEVLVIQEMEMNGRCHII